MKSNDKITVTQNEEGFTVSVKGHRESMINELEAAVSEVTQEQIDEAINHCIWRLDLGDVSICRGATLPCDVVIEHGQCDILQVLLGGERWLHFD